MNNDVTVLLVVICFLLLAVLWGLAWVAGRMNRNHQQLMKQVIVQGRGSRFQRLPRSDR